MKKFAYWLLALTIFFFGVWLITGGWHNFRDSRDVAASAPSDDYEEVIARFGKPDRVDSTEYDPQPPTIPIRVVEYRSQGVKIIFRPEGTAPPYVWHTLGYVDLWTNTALSEQGALTRLRRLQR